MSLLVAYPGIFRLFMKGKFDAYTLAKRVQYAKVVVFELVLVYSSMFVSSLIDMYIKKILRLTYFFAKYFN